MKLFYSFFLLYSFFVQSSGIKTWVDLNNQYDQPISFAESELTLEEKNLPEITGPVDFLNFTNLYEKNQLIHLAQDLLLETLRTGVATHILKFLQSTGEIPNNSNLLEKKLINSKKEYAVDVDELIQSIKETKVSKSYQFIAFVDLLYDNSVSDGDIIKFIEFMDLPKDYALNTGELKFFQELKLLPGFFDKRFGGRDIELNILNKLEEMLYLDVEWETTRNEDSVKKAIYSFVETSGARLTTLGHEIARSSRIDLINKFIREKRFNFKQVDAIQNTILHNLSQNLYIDGEHWRTIINDIKRTNPDVDFNVINNEGFAPITFLAERNLFDSLKVFHEKINADIYIKDIYGRSLFQIAAVNLPRESVKADTIHYLYQQDTKGEMNKMNFLNQYVIKNYRPVVFKPISYFHVNFVTYHISDMLGVLHGKEIGLAKYKQLLDGVRDFQIDLATTEKLREDAISSVFLSKDTIFSHILSAIADGDVSFLKKAHESNPKDLNQYLSISVPSNLNKVKNSSEKTKSLSMQKRKIYGTTHFFLEAIRYNQPEVVKFMLDKIDILSLTENRDPEKNTVMDPFIGAILTTQLIGLDDDGGRKKSEEIIDMLIEDERIPVEGKMFVGLRPIEIASLLGRLDIIKLLHKKKDIFLPYGNIFIGKNSTGIEYSDLAFAQGYMKLFDYYNKIAVKNREKEALENSSGAIASKDELSGNCKKIFLH